MKTFKWSDQARRFLEKNQYKQAIFYAQRGIKVAPQDRLNYLYLEIAYLLQGETQSAQEIGNNIFANDNNWNQKQELMSILDALALYYLQNGQPQSAQILYQKIQKLNPQHIDSYLGLGMSFYQQKDYESAIQYLTQFLQLDPNYFYAYYHLGNCYKVQDEWSDAIKNFRQAIAINNQFAEAYRELGYCLLVTKNIEKAIISLQKAIELNPNFSEAYCNLGNCYKQQEQYERAIENFQTAIKLRPNFAEAYFNWGMTLQAQEKFNLAIEKFNEALQLNPNLAEGYCNLGVCYERKGKFVEALANLEKSLELNPKLTEAYYNLGYFYRYQGNLSKAISLLREGLKYPTKNKDIKEQIKNLIQQIEQCQIAQYFPQLEQGDNAWDAMLFRDDDCYRLFYLTGSSQIKPHWILGSLAYATSKDLKTWDYQGIVLEPDEKTPWRSGRILAGSLYKEDGKYYFFYSASSKEFILIEKISLLTSDNGIDWQEQQEFLLELDLRYYQSRLSFHQNFDATVNNQHDSWRDPYIVKENNQYYMFFTSNAPGNSNFQGCIGCAVSDRIDGDYQIMPPVFYPTLENSDEGLFLEMERPQITYQHGKYHLFFCMVPKMINPKWLDKIGREDIRAFTVYWYIADKITGPFLPSSNKPIVKNSGYTGLYGTQFIQDFDGNWFAYGAYGESKTLEVSPRFPVKWDQDLIEIILES